MDEDISLVDLAVGQAVLTEKIAQLRLDSSEKHIQNRRDIHRITNGLQDVSDKVWKLQLKIVGFSTLGGVVATIVGEIIKAVIHK